jgi:hypothetical protein
MTNLDANGLEQILNVWGPYFISANDISFISNLSKVAKSQDINDAEKLVVEKATKHAWHNKQFGTVGYQISNEYVAPNSLNEMITEYLGNKFMGAEFAAMLRDINHQLENNVTLSAKQVQSVENILSYVQIRVEEEKNGYLFFNPKGDREASEFAKRLVNYGLSGKCVHTFRPEQALQFRERFDTAEKIDDLLINLAGTGVNSMTMKKYWRGAQLLKDYIPNADPAFYEINGLHFAKPKIDQNF